MAAHSVREWITLLCSLITTYLLMASPLLADNAIEQAAKNRYEHHPPPQKMTFESAPKEHSSSLQPTSEGSQIWQGITSSFAFAPFNGEQDHWLSGFSGNLALNYPLSASLLPTHPNQVALSERDTNETLTLSMKYQFAGNWFVAGTLYHYLKGEAQQDWNPDFTYLFGYDDWRPYTLSLVYANYGGNRFQATDDLPVTRFDQGTWSLGWKFPIVEPVIDWLKVTDESAMGCQINYNYTRNYFDLASLTEKLNHQTVSLGCKYVITGNWYMNATAFYYLDKTQQQPWNPDFTYGFGYFDWRPGTWTLQYNNYSGNRWNGEPAEDTGEFKHGSIMLAYSFAF
ncbi:hypothetical protein [Vibrio stylophorae]|nr:hypothetical protein [Vibrio stylophorae]